LRDRALISVMVFTFARVSAPCGRLHEKGGKFHNCLRLEAYLAEYLDGAQLGSDGRVPLFQPVKHRPYGRGTPELNGRCFDRLSAWQMVQRRAKAAASAPRSATTPSAAPASPLTWRTAACWRRRAKWQRMPYRTT
jgi:hypothetical protein